MGYISLSVVSEPSARNKNYYSGTSKRFSGLLVKEGLLVVFPKIEVIYAEVPLTVKEWRKKKTLLRKIK